LFFFNVPATPQLYTLSLHDALPIYLQRRLVRPVAEHDAIVAIGRPRRWHLFWLHDDRSIESRLLGERVSVIPVGSALADLEAIRSEEHTSELQSRRDLVCRLLLEKK